MTSFAHVRPSVLVKLFESFSCSSLVPRVSARYSYIQSSLLESFSTGRAALGLLGSLVEGRAVSLFASGLCGVACLPFRKRSSVQI